MFLALSNLLLLILFILKHVKFMTGKMVNICVLMLKLVVDTLLTPIIPAQLKEDGPKCSSNSGRSSPSSSPQRRELWRPEDFEDTSTDSRKERATSPGKTRSMWARKPRLRIL